MRPQHCVPGLCRHRHGQQPPARIQQEPRSLCLRLVRGDQRTWRPSYIPSPQYKAGAPARPPPSSSVLMTTLQGQPKQLIVGQHSQPISPQRELLIFKGPFWPKPFCELPNQTLQCLQKPFSGWDTASTQAKGPLGSLYLAGELLQRVTGSKQHGHLAEPGPGSQRVRAAARGSSQSTDSTCSWRTTEFH